MFTTTIVAATLGLLGAVAAYPTAAAAEAANVFEKRCNNGYNCLTINEIVTGGGSAACRSAYKSHGLCGQCCNFSYNIPGVEPDDPDTEIYTCQKC